MGVQEETLRLKNEVVGQEQVQALEKGYASFASTVIQVSGHVVALGQAEKTLAGDTAELTAEQRKLIAALEDAARHEQTAATATAKASATKQAATRSARDLNIAVQQAAYGLGDLASTSGDLGQKLMSASNNVQFATARMGPWGVAAGLVVVAIASLATNWDKLRESLGFANDAIDLSKTKLENLEAQVERLKDKKVKLSVDHLELDAAEAELKRLKDGLDAFRQAEKTRNQFERESGSQVGEVLAEAPGGEAEVVNKLRALVFRLGEATSPNLREAREKADQAAEEANRVIAENGPEELMGASSPEKLRLLQARKDFAKYSEESRSELRKIGEGAQATVGDILKKAQEGDQHAQKRLAGLLDQAGMGGHAGSVRGSSAQAIKDYDEEDQAFEASNARAKATRERRENAERLRKQAETAEKQKDQAAFDKAQHEAAGLLESTASQIERGGDKAKLEAVARAMMGKAGLSGDEVNRATPRLMREAAARAQRDKIRDEIQDSDPEVVRKKAEHDKKQADAEQKKKVDAAAKLFDKSGLKEQAEGLYVSLVNGGASHEYAAAQVRAGIGRAVRQDAPGLDAATSQGVQTKIGGEAKADLQKRMIALQEDGIRGQRMAVELMGQLNAELARNGQKLHALENEILRIAKSASSRRTALPRGPSF